MKSKNSGFTLVEIVFALTVFAAGMLVIWQSLYAVYGAHIAAGNVRMAAEILQNQLYEVQSGDYSEGRITVEQPGYSGFSVVREARALRQDMDEIKVEVFWNEKGKDKSSSAVTFRSKSRK